MSMAFFDKLPRSQLNAMLPFAPAHMRPILLAVRDHGIAWVTIPQRAGRFEIPGTKPLLAVIGDDMHVAMGPAGFHRESIRRLIAQARVIAIVASEPLPRAYVEAVKAPVEAGLTGLIIETRPERELEWVGLVKAENPTAGLILASVKETAQ